MARPLRPLATVSRSTNRDHDVELRQQQGRVVAVPEQAPPTPAWQQPLLTSCSKHDLPHHWARHPSPLSNTPELSGSHVAVMAPMSSAVECHGTYRLTGPATLIKATSADSLEAYLGQGAKLELYTGDGIITMTHAVSAAAREGSLMEGHRSKGNPARYHHGTFLSLYLLWCSHHPGMAVLLMSPDAAPTCPTCPHMQDSSKADFSEEPFYCICMGMHFEVKGQCEITSARRGGRSGSNSFWGGGGRSGNHRGDWDGNVWGSGSLHHHHHYRHQLPHEPAAQPADHTYSSDDDQGDPRFTLSKESRSDSGPHRAAFEHEGNLVLKVAALSQGTKLLLAQGAELWHPLCLGTPRPVSSALLPVQPQRVITT